MGKKANVNIFQGYCYMHMAKAVQHLGGGGKSEKKRGKEEGKKEGREGEEEERRGEEGRKEGMINGEKIQYREKNKFYLSGR